MFQLGARYLLFASLGRLGRRRGARGEYASLNAHFRAGYFGTRITERTSLDQAEVLLGGRPYIEEIEDGLLDRERTITRELVSLSPALAAAASREAIAEIEKRWLEIDRSLEESETELRRRTGIIQQQMNRLDVTRRVWELTVKAAQDARAPNEVVTLARTTTDDVAGISKSLRQTLDRALALQAKVGRARGTVQESLDRIKAEETSLLRVISCAVSGHPCGVKRSRGTTTGRSACQRASRTRQMDVRVPVGCG